MIDTDRETLSAVFEARVSLAKISEEQAVIDARDEWHKTQKWVRSPARRQGSFVWMCDLFGYEPSAVRRKIGC